MTHSNLIDQLRRRLTAPLPGLAAQWKMTSRAFDMDAAQAIYNNLPPNHRTAGVLVLLYQKNDQWHTALMQRPESPYAHSKQISFPGGMHEPTDPDHQTTALREAYEEFGIPPQQVDVLGKLTNLYIPVSNFLVHPYIGYLADVPAFVRDPAEVVEILETPLEWILQPDRRKITAIPITDKTTLREVPYFDLHDRIVWGATAMMLSELAEILTNLEQ